MAEADEILTELYLLAYGISDLTHPWATSIVNKAEENPYFGHLSTYLDTYKKMAVSSLGISFSTFMQMGREEMITLLNKLTEDMKK